MTSSPRPQAGWRNAWRPGCPPLIAPPVYTAELCAALGSSARRLLLARRALRGRRGQPELAKSVALDHGFWHLGHFARDYRALFGELPSETLAAE